ncbi:MAG: adenylate kinase [Firmicutes bacterium]|nr:adenylate kinase [Bacillota bacterium]
MNLIILGAPGAGKGTQAEKIIAKYRLPHISTGDIFRANIRSGTPVGLKAKGYIDKGQLVPDEVVIELVQGRLSEEDCKNGYLLDGFPRTLAQAQALDKITKIETVINLDVDLSKLLARIVGRRTCPVCNMGTNTAWDSYTKECPKCEVTYIQRPDDTEETVKNRLDVYNNQTVPLIEYYKRAGVLKNVNGMGTVDEVFAGVVEVLG